MFCFVRTVVNSAMIERKEVVTEPVVGFLGRRYTSRSSASSIGTPISLPMLQSVFIRPFVVSLSVSGMFLISTPDDHDLYWRSVIFFSRFSIGIASLF